MLIPLWGADYFDRWLNVSAATLWSDHNIPFLQKHVEFELVFLTKSQDLPLVSETIAPRLSRGLTVKAITIDEFFPRKRHIPYGVPLTLAYIKGVQDLGAAGIGTFVILMNADFVLADGSLQSLLQKIQQGYHIITAPSLRVNDETARAALLRHLRGLEGNAGVAARSLMALAERHQHHTVLARTLNEPHIMEAWYYHLVYWRLSHDCLAARYFLMMPFCFQLRRQITMATCPIDYGFIEQVCPGGRYTALCDSDEFLMLELQPRHSEAELLMPARTASSQAQLLEQRIAQVAANAQRWSTFEHRRAFEHTLLFHSSDLAPEHQAGLAEFDTRMSDILRRMAAPVPSQRHPHWLGALHHYRAAMTENDEATYPQLIQGETNRFSVMLFSGRVEAQRSVQCPIDLGKYLSSVDVIVTLDNLACDVIEKFAATAIFLAKIEDAHSNDLDMEFMLHDPPAFARGQRLGLYLLIDSLPHWPKFRTLCEAALDASSEVVLLFRNDSWTEVRFEGHSWILSRLMDYFSDYSAQVEFISRFGRGAGGDTVASVRSFEPYISDHGGSVSPLVAGTFVGFVIRLVRRR